MPQLIAVDWGTSSLRGARLDDAGRVLEEKSAPLGILNVPNGDFAGVFAAHFSDWMKPAGSVCLISGMAGSRQGWHEAPYVACPAGPDELRRRLHWIEPGRIALVPGLSDERDDVPDVMRGGGTDFRRHAAGRPFGGAVRPARHPQQMGHCAGRPDHRLSYLHDRRVLWIAEPAFHPGTHARGRCTA